MGQMSRPIECSVASVRAPKSSRLLPNFGSDVVGEVEDCGTDSGGVLVGVIVVAVAGWPEAVCVVFPGLLVD